MEILFVCTGNTCRSAMAEGLFNREAERRGLALHARSCGIMAFPAPASENAITAARELGADISSHVARQITRETVDGADYVFCMTERHLRAVERAFPDCKGKLFTLAERDVADPYGGSLDDYRACAREIRSAIERLMPKLEEKLR